MKVIQTSKVVGRGRTYLGPDVMKILGVTDGDHVMYYRSKDGRVYVDKVRSPEEACGK